MRVSFNSTVEEREDRNTFKFRPLKPATVNVPKSLLLKSLQTADSDPSVYLYHDAPLGFTWMPLLIQVGVMVHS